MYFITFALYAVCSLRLQHFVLLLWKCIILINWSKWKVFIEIEWRDWNAQVFPWIAASVRIELRWTLLNEEERSKMVTPPQLLIAIIKASVSILMHKLYLAFVALPSAPSWKFSTRFDMTTQAKPNNKQQQRPRFHHCSWCVSLIYLLSLSLVYTFSNCEGFVVVYVC